jgi:hypothetical protein
LMPQWLHRGVPGLMHILVARLFACGSNTRTAHDGADTNTQWSYSDYSCETFYCSAFAQVTALALRRGERDLLCTRSVFSLAVLSRCINTGNSGWALNECQGKASARKST